MPSGFYSTDALFFALCHGDFIPHMHFSLQNDMESVPHRCTILHDVM